MMSEAKQSCHPVVSHPVLPECRTTPLATCNVPPLWIIQVPVSSWSSWSEAQPVVCHPPVFSHCVCVCVRAWVYTVDGYSSALWHRSMHHKASLCSVLTVYGNLTKLCIYWTLIYWPIYVNGLKKETNVHDLFQMHVCIGLDFNKWTYVHVEQELSESHFPHWSTWNKSLCIEVRTTSAQVVGRNQ